MPEIGTVNTLVKTRDEIRATIRMYEKRIARARSRASPPSCKCFFGRLIAYKLTRN
jgi:hypothetical protein